MSTTAHDRQDIVIIGGGLVGMALALSLAKADPELRLTMVEPQAEPQPDVLTASHHEPRVSALTLSSEQLLRQLGCWDFIAQRACAYQRMDVWDGEGTAAIQFDAAQLYETHLGHIVENAVILAALCRQLSQYPNIQVLRGYKLAKVSAPQPGQANHSGYRALELAAVEGGERKTLSASLLVAADGAQSRTRELGGLAVHELDYQHQAIVTTVRVQYSHQFTAWQRFTEDGPLAFLPLSDTQGSQQYCSIVWSTSPDHARQLLALDDAAFCAALERAFESRLGSVLSCDQRYTLPLSHRHAPQYAADRLVLVGDAAHSIHPLAGQGVNLGFMDAWVLAEEIIAARRQSVDFATLTWLRRYQRRRQGENMKMLAAMAGFRYLYGDVPPLLQSLRNSGMRWVNSCTPIKTLFAHQAMGLDKITAE